MPTLTSAVQTRLAPPAQLAPPSSDAPVSSSLIANAGNLLLALMQQTYKLQKEVDTIKQQRNNERLKKNAISLKDLSNVKAELMKVKGLIEAYGSTGVGVYIPTVSWATTASIEQLLTSGTERNHRDIIRYAVVDDSNGKQIMKPGAAQVSILDAKVQLTPDGELAKLCLNYINQKWPNRDPAKLSNSELRQSLYTPGWTIITGQLDNAFLNNQFPLWLVLDMMGNRGLIPSDAKGLNGSTDAGDLYLALNDSVSVDPASGQPIQAKFDERWSKIDWTGHPWSTPITIVPEKFEAAQANNQIKIQERDAETQKINTEIKSLSQESLDLTDKFKEFYASMIRKMQDLWKSDRA